MSRAAAPIRCLQLPTHRVPQQATRGFCMRSRALPTAACRPRLATASRPTCPQVSQRREKSYKSESESKSEYKFGPFSWKSGLIFALTCGGLVWYFDSEKKRMQRKRIAEANKGAGKPKVGGPFELVDQDGNKFTSEDLKGRYSLVYFGFTHCPDICPEELDKMARTVDLVLEKRPGALVPVFVTCDPARDGPKELKEYLSEFHNGLVGLTGTYDQVKAMCKAYRVYFSTPSNVRPGEDYLVDHSVYFYLMDPDGDFVEALGRQHSPGAGAEVILEHMRDWTGTRKFA